MWQKVDAGGNCSESGVKDEMAVDVDYKDRCIVLYRRMDYN